MLGDSQIDLTTIWRGKWYFVICVAISLLLGVAYLLLVDPEYDLGARLLVEEKGLPLELGQPAPRDKVFLPTQAEIIRSPAVIDRAVKLCSPRAWSTHRNA